MAVAESSAASSTILSVYELNQLIKDHLEKAPQFMNCLVAGEISNFKHHSSGHMYFTLKDANSRIQVVMFASRNQRLAFRPEDGMRVVCGGRIGVFERNGQYQLYADTMQPDGIGALYVAFEQLRNKLASEGLFDTDRKRALPKYPLRIGVVTSPTGAVIRDICTTLERRYPLAKVILAPALVQGPGAAATIVDGLKTLWALDEPVDVIIVGRGGGSLEELWPFNEEAVARAVASSPIPVVSAVGHETDVTICDFVADIRAATPTAAAELVAPHVQDLRMTLQQISERTRLGVTRAIDQGRKRLVEQASRQVLADPRRILDKPRQTLDFMELQAQNSIAGGIQRRNRDLTKLREQLYVCQPTRQIRRVRDQLGTFERRAADCVTKQVYSHTRKFESLLATLDALNPMKVLGRGYSLIYREEDGQVLQSVKDVKPGMNLTVHVSDGEYRATVRDYAESNKNVTRGKANEGAEHEDGRATQARLDI